MYDGFGDIFQRARAVAAAERAAHARRRRRQLRDVGLAHVPLDARDHVPAAPVPGGGRGERRRAHISTRRSGSSRSTSSRSTSSCCRSRSAGCCTSRPGRVDADTFVLTLPISRGAARARALRLHRRPLRGDRHGDRGDDRALDHGLQRPRHAGAAAHGSGCGSPSAPICRRCCSASGAARSS